ncbi:alpha/beta hydrolase [Flavobacterium branchiophilum]|uniref:Alpha/beta hydrolase n=1 Tax=Flavobacterium branchiophilum (strain FL-15) TaxID=1034807 RepID=G2Z4R0_FLABF|nr:alpha/beta hydrolase [Flavobacterium branchiophilum]CCB68547.1 Protein of unknown function [Flavobacterium branchiophilum FL-15]
MNKIPVYFMPGLAASSQIFENIKLPLDQFDMYYLEWFLPLDNEPLEAYAGRMAQNIKHDNAVLIGVSFGGILVQEMAKLIRVQKVIIISSVKSNVEFPQRMKMAKATQLYKILPTGWLSDIEKLSKFAFGSLAKNRIALYRKFLTLNDKKYLDWALEQIICWKQQVEDSSVLHIHGDNDSVFPVKNIRNYIPVKGGTHVMIVNKFKWLNEHLPGIILNGVTKDSIS